MYISASPRLVCKGTNEIHNPFCRVAKHSLWRSSDMSTVMDAQVWMGLQRSFGPNIYFTDDGILRRVESSAIRELPFYWPALNSFSIIRRARVVIVLSATWPKCLPFPAINFLPNCKSHFLLCVLVRIYSFPLRSCIFHSSNSEVRGFFFCKRKILYVFALQALWPLSLNLSHAMWGISSYRQCILAWVWLCPVTLYLQKQEQGEFVPCTNSTETKNSISSLLPFLILHYNPPCPVCTYINPARFAL